MHSPGYPVDWAVRFLDRILRRLLGIWEFSDDPECIYRLSLGRAGKDISLPDGSAIRRGEALGILHLWSEHLPPVPGPDSGLAWAAAVSRTSRKSLRILAGRAAHDPVLARLSAFGNPGVYFGVGQSTRLLETIGFAVSLEPLPKALPRRFLAAIARRWAWLLRRAFNPHGRDAMRPSDLQRYEIWLTRRTLMEKYAPALPPSTRESR